MAYGSDIIMAAKLAKARTKSQDRLNWGKALASVGQTIDDYRKEIETERARKAREELARAYFNLQKTSVEGAQESRAKELAFREAQAGMTPGGYEELAPIAEAARQSMKEKREGVRIGNILNRLKLNNLVTYGPGERGLKRKLTLAQITALLAKAKPDLTPEQQADLALRVARAQALGAGEGKAEAAKRHPGLLAARQPSTFEEQRKYLEGMGYTPQEVAKILILKTKKGTSLGTAISLYKALQGSVVEAPPPRLTDNGKPNPAYQAWEKQRIADALKSVFGIQSGLSGQGSGSNGGMLQPRGPVSDRITMTPPSLPPVGSAPMGQGGLPPLPPVGQGGLPPIPVPKPSAPAAPAIGAGATSPSLDLAPSGGVWTLFGRYAPNDPSWRPSDEDVKAVLRDFQENPSQAKADLIRKWGLLEWGR